MAIQIVPILKTIGPLVANASGIVASLKSNTATADKDQRIKRLEEEALQAGELLAATTRQLEAVAEQLRVQSDLNEIYERRSKRNFYLALIAIALSVAAVAVALAN